MTTVPPPTGSPRTSSFFDTPTATPPPAPRWVPRAPPLITPSPLSLSRASSRTRKPLPSPLDKPDCNGPLSPLHQSPSLSTGADHPDWRPPLPPSSEDVNLRFDPNPTYMLGEGRYAQVYLASYKQSSTPHPSPDRANHHQGPSTGSSWRLCAAKRMAPDRESQTMGLREAFFLNRLAPGRGGSVFIVRLIAVKEDIDKRAVAHHRSTSDAIGPKHRMTRQRSSTMDDPTLVTSPSVPALAQAARTGPAISRLVLVLEHAPLGTMDRLLRSSPTLVGRDLWGRWARQATDALAWVHEKGVVHADVKPGNLLVRLQRRKAWPSLNLQLTQELDLRLSDFGSSLLVHSAHPPTDGVGLGTLPFSPPELVNPTLSFSFPIDIFALGATLYQCITGQEPYRGCRPIEIMHHVRKGDLWMWEERVRLSRVGTEGASGGTPYPSAWREQNNEGIRRGGSLRVPTSAVRPSLARMPSAESLKASEDLTDAQTGYESPAGIKLWAKWMQRSSIRDPVAALLAEDGPTGNSETPSERAESPSMSRSVPERLAIDSLAYRDGSPSMVFLDGQEMVAEGIREVLKAMVDADPDERPTAREVNARWAELIPPTE